MYNPLPGWLPAPSFVEPVTPPTTEPDASPGVQVCFSAEWLPYVIGSLQQMCQPTAWDAGSPSALQTALDRAQGLLELFGEAGGCVMLRWSTPDCALEESTDGGVTWSPISGWALAGVQSCVLAGLSIRIDSGGNLQWSIDGGTTWINVSGWPPPPVTQPGQSTPDQACSIASYLANDVIQQGLATAVDSFNNGRQQLQNWANFSDLLVFWEPLLPVVFNAAAGLYGLYTAGSIANLTAASTDVALFTAVRCAIYNAIKADGKVTDGNFAAIQAALAALTYPSMDASNAIQGFVADLGAPGLEGLQVAAPWAIGDCISCGSECALFNGTNDEINLAGDVLTGGSLFSMGGWIETSLSSHIQTIFQIGYNGTDCPAVSCWIDTNGHLNVDVRGGDCVDNITTETTFVLTDGNPHQIMVFLNGSTGCSIYIDAGFRGVGGGIRTDLNGTGAVGHFGFGLGGGTGRFQGKMWGWAAYHRAVTTSELNAWAALPYTYPAGPVYEWPMNEGTGATVHDLADGATGTWTGSGAHWGTYP